MNSSLMPDHVPIFKFWKAKISLPNITPFSVLTTSSTLKISSINSAFNRHRLQSSSIFWFYICFDFVSLFRSSLMLFFFFSPFRKQISMLPLDLNCIKHHFCTVGDIDHPFQHHHHCNATITTSPTPSLLNNDLHFFSSPKTHLHC